MLSKKFIGLCGFASLCPSGHGGLSKTGEWSVGDLKVLAFDVGGSATVVAFELVCGDLSLSPVCEVRALCVCGCVCDVFEQIEIGSALGDVFRGAPASCAVLGCARVCFEKFFQDPSVSSEFLGFISRQPPGRALFFTGYDCGGVVAQLFSLLFLG